jgi:hypothetical protein
VRGYTPPPSLECQSRPRFYAGSSHVPSTMLRMGRIPGRACHLDWRKWRERTVVVRWLQAWTIVDHDGVRLSVTQEEPSTPKAPTLGSSPMYGGGGPCAAWWRGRDRAEHPESFVFCAHLHRRHSTSPLRRLRRHLPRVAGEDPTSCLSWIVVCLTGNDCGAQRTMRARAVKPRCATGTQRQCR